MTEYYVSWWATCRFTIQGTGSVFLLYGDGVVWTTLSCPPKMWNLGITTKQKTQRLHAALNLCPQDVLFELIWLSPRSGVTLWLCFSRQTLQLYLLTSVQEKLLIILWYLLIINTLHQQDHGRNIHKIIFLFFIFSINQSSNNYIFDYIIYVIDCLRRINTHHLHK